MITPRVTVGIPVYNGASTLEAAVRPLLEQTFEDIEVLVSDNASIDDTPAVVARLAREDPRIRYVRQPINLGANGNYSFVARDARGEFLKWASASDWCAPTFTERCVAALDADPGAVVAAPRTRLFEGDIASAIDYDGDLEILGETPLERLKDILKRQRLNNAFNGLIRLDALRRTRLVEPYLLADEVLMGNLALMGRILLVDEPLFWRRMEVGTSTTLQDADSRLWHHYPDRSARWLLQAWKQQIGWLRAGWTAPMRPSQRRAVMTYLLRRVGWERRSLAADLRGALRFALRHTQ